MMVRFGLISAVQLEAGLALVAADGGTLPEALVQLGHVGDAEVTEFFRARLVIPQVDANALAKISPRAIAAVPPDMAIEFRLVPIALDREGTLTIAMSDPADTRAIDELTFFTNNYIVRNVATQAQIAWCLAHYYGFVSELARMQMVPDTVQPAAVQPVAVQPAAVLTRTSGAAPLEPLAPAHDITPAAVPRYRVVAPVTGPQPIDRPRSRSVSGELTAVRSEINAEAHQQTHAHATPSVLTATTQASAMANVVAEPMLSVPAPYTPPRRAATEKQPSLTPVPLATDDDAPYAATIPPPIPAPKLKRRAITEDPPELNPRAGEFTSRVQSATITVESAAVVIDLAALGDPAAPAPADTAATVDKVELEANVPSVIIDDSLAVAKREAVPQLAPPIVASGSGRIERRRRSVPPDEEPVLLVTPSVGEMRRRTSQAPIDDAETKPPLPPAPTPEVASANAPQRVVADRDSKQAIVEPVDPAADHSAPVELQPKAPARKREQTQQGLGIATSEVPLGNAPTGDATIPMHLPDVIPDDPTELRTPRARTITGTGTAATPPAPAVTDHAAEPASRAKSLTQPGRATSSAEPIMALAVQAAPSSALADEQAPASPTAAHSGLPTSTEKPNTSSESATTTPLPGRTIETQTNASASPQHARTTEPQLDGTTTPQLARAVASQADTATTSVSSAALGAAPNDALPHSGTAATPLTGTTAPPTITAAPNSSPNAPPVDAAVAVAAPPPNRGASESAAPASAPTDAASASTAAAPALTDAAPLADSRDRSSTSGVAADSAPISAPIPTPVTADANEWTTASGRVYENVDDGWGPPGSTIPPFFAGPYLEDISGAAIAILTGDQSEPTFVTPPPAAPDSAWPTNAAIPAPVPAMPPEPAPAAAPPAALAPLATQASPAARAASASSAIPTPRAHSTTGPITPWHGPATDARTLERAAADTFTLLGALDACADRDAVIACLLDHLAASHREALFCVVRGKECELFARRPGNLPHPLPTLHVGQPSAIATVIEHRLPTRGPILPDIAAPFLRSAFGREPLEVVLIPIVVRDRVIAVWGASERIGTVYDEHLALVARAAGMALARVAKTVRTR